MSFLAQMKMPGLIDLALILILANISKGQIWSVDVDQHIDTTVGSNVTIRCSFTYPTKLFTEDLQVYWKKKEISRIIINDIDKNALVYHPDSKLVLEKYRGKTKLIGDKDKGNCSLQINDIQDNEPTLYVRVIAKGDQFSFKKNTVNISLHGVKQGGPEKQPGTQNVTSAPLPTYEGNTVTSDSYSAVPETERTSMPRYAVALLSVAAFLFLVVVAGIVFCIAKKRSKPFTRKESGHYANFSRAASDQAKRESYDKRQEKDPAKLPEPKIIDEPVYINIEAPSNDSNGRMTQTMDYRENIYGNVDYGE